MESSLIRFIAEPVQVEYDQLAGLEKKPECPDRFIWNGDRYAIVELVSEWHDYRRRGRMARNMRPEHAAMASRWGSIGVGTFFFWVRTEEGRVFDQYYDRAPKDADHRKGEWLLFQELVIP